MKVVWTEKDRQHYRDIAWSHCKTINAPRHVRVMLRDALAKDLMDRAAASMTAKTDQTTGIVSK